MALVELGRFDRQEAFIVQGRLEAEARATPLGLLAVGGLVAAILLSVPPIVRAKRHLLAPPRD